MNEEKILLPDFIIADLFKNHLVEPLREASELAAIQSSPTSKNSTKEKHLKPTLQYLGENKKRIVVLVYETDAPTITDNSLTFLTKILNACNLNLADIAIINVESQKTSFDQLKKEFNAEVILLIGVEPAVIQLPFTMPNFQVQPFSNCTIVSAPKLSSMLEETTESISLKRQLWTSLQKAFKLN